MKKNSPATTKTAKRPPFVLRAERALLRAADNVRAQNRTLNQPVIVWKDGKTAETGVITEDVRPADCGTPEQAIFEEEALKKGIEEPSAAMLSPRVEGFELLDASEKDFAKRKAEGHGCWSSRCQFVEKGRGGLR